jgi:hypothetical protein
MASPFQSGTTDLVTRAIRLNRELREFATSGKLSGEYDSQRRFLSGVPDEQIGAVVQDWFIFDWPGSDGNGVLGEFLESHPQLSKPDQRLLIEWAESILTIFLIDRWGQTIVHLHELDSDSPITAVPAAEDSQRQLQAGEVIVARVLAAGDRYIFSRPPIVMPDVERALMALEFRDAIAALNRPELIEQVLLEQRAAFMEYFGAPKITRAAADLMEAMAAFRQHLLTQARSASVDLSSSGSPSEWLVRELAVPEVSSHAISLSSHDQITALFDEFEGLVLLPSYEEFRRVFQSEDPEADVPGWRDLVWTYIRDPEIPLLAFESVAEEYGDRVEEVLRMLLNNPSFSGDHLYALLLHYKDPVTGLDTLEDDERLWDLLDGAGARSAKDAIPQESSSVQVSSRSDATVAGNRQAASAGAGNLSRRTPEPSGPVVPKKRSQGTTDSNSTKTARSLKNSAGAKSVKTGHAKIASKATAPKADNKGLASKRSSKKAVAPKASKAAGKSGVASYPKTKNGPGKRSKVPKKKG